VGHKYTREQLLDAAIDAAVDEGIGQLTFGRLAKRIGVSDRIIVYYFPTKDTLIGDVLMAVGIRLQVTVTAAAVHPAADHRELLRMVWPALTGPKADVTFALFFEAVGHAAARREPYATLVPLQFEAWCEWLTGFVDGPPRRRRDEAEATVAVLDGLLMLRQIMGPQAAQRAAAVLGLS
jgi:AcrR family transcriptional regulator